MATATSGSCVQDAKVEISLNLVTPVWFTLPCIMQVTKTFRDQQVGETRNSHTGRKFVSACGTSSRTEVYTCRGHFANDDPLDWYLQDGVEYKVRVTKGSVGAEAQFVDVFNAKYVENGFDWDNTTKDNEEQTFAFEVTSDVTRTRPLQAAGKPYYSS